MECRKDLNPSIAAFNLRRLTIISGGQTGVDRSALDVAIEHNICHGGWCPRGRLAEDGPIAPCYQLRETPSSKYAQRTEWNVRDSDATVVFTVEARIVGGTLLTLEIARRLNKPLLCLHRGNAASPTVASAASKLIRFLCDNRVQRLNVAGPRGSQQPEAAEYGRSVLKRVFNSLPGREYASTQH